VVGFFYDEEVPMDAKTTAEQQLLNLACQILAWRDENGWRTSTAPDAFSEKVKALIEAAESAIK